MPYKDSEKKKEYDREYKKKNHEKCRAGSIKYHAGNKAYWKDKDPYEEAEKKGITEKACPGCSHISGREKLPIRAFAKDSDVCNKLKLDHADEFFIDHIIRILQNLGFTVSKNGEDSIKDMIRVLEQLGYIVGKKRQQTLFGD